jgi:hypothetical protein
MRTVLTLFVLAAPALAMAPPPFPPSAAAVIRHAVEKIGNDNSTDQALRKELLARKEAEQKLRFEFVEASKKGATNADMMKRLTETDRANREWLLGVIDKGGWPGIPRVGYDGADAAWLLVQHADADRPFQTKALDILREAVKRKEARPTHLAYLTDRVVCAEEKKQLYGTQFIVRDGRSEPQPIDDETNLDKRRAEVGLRPFAEYREQLEKVYGK